MQHTQKQHIFMRILILSTLIFLVPLSSPAQTVNIPDPNLRKAINEVLSKSPNVRITVEDMRTLRDLRVENKDIRNLKGIETATNLEELRLHNNLISDLSPLAGLINLRHLDLDRNLVDDLSPLKGLTNLRSLQLAHNLVSDLSPLAGLVKLEWMGMTDNPLADLSPLSGLTNFQSFHSWGTPIVNPQALVGLPKLREINICGGEISDISFLASATGLRELYLVNNEISDISALAELTNLRRISLEHNEVSDLSPLQDLKNLTWIDLRDNAISDVSPLSDVPNLTWVDLSENNIMDVSSLTSLRSLNWMGLNGNTLTDTSVLERFSEGTSISHSDFVNSAFPEAGPKIQGPWLWIIVPGLLDNRDLLSKASKGTATEVKVSTFGATEGKVVGRSKWASHRLASIGGDNLNQMTDALGWGAGSEIYDHVVYGSLTLQSPRKQETTMLVGSDDAVKVWLNGEVVHYNPVARGAGDFQDAFPVTLKQGGNVLLVAVDNRGHGAFSGFFGFSKETEYTVNPPTRKITVTVPAWDVNRDGITNVLDLILVGQDFGKATSTNARTDVNRDKKRDIKDLILVANHLGELSGAAAPAISALSNATLKPTIIRAWIAQAQVENDGSPIFQQGIANLQRLLGLIFPENTALLSNYPNPFNPETWIPYQLAETNAVTLYIYAVNGGLVRTLDLGHQAAGRYYERSHAAYWDGKNDVGEPVASGVYFYTLTAGDFTATRKMLIRK